MKQNFFGALKFGHFEDFGCPNMPSFPWASQIISTKYQIGKLANLSFIMFFGRIGMLGHPKSSKYPNFNSPKRSLFFPPPLGLFGTPDHILQDICLKPWRGFIFGPYAHFLLMKFFSKNLKFFFDFLKIQRGDPVD